MGDLRITLGDLELVQIDPPTDGYTLSLLGDDSTWGNPVPAMRTIRSMLFDGDQVTTDRHGNREVSFRVEIEASDSASLNAGHAALWRAVKSGSTTLTWTPADGWAEPTVFDVVDGDLNHALDDFEETRFTRRAFTVTLWCLPWTRPETPITVAALSSPTGTPPTPTTTNLADGTTTTGWTGSSTVTTAGGYVRVFDGGGSGASRLSLAGSFNMSTTTYLTVVAAEPYPLQKPRPANAGITATGTVTGGGFAVRLTKVAEVAVISGSRLIHTATFVTTTSTYTSFDFLMQFTGSGYFEVDSVNRTNVPPFTGTARQKYQTLDVLGSARTPGSLSIQQGVDGLGEVLVYVTPEGTTPGYQPSLRQRRTGGAIITADTSLVSGAREDIATQAVYSIPASDLPAGQYLLLGRFRHQTTTTARTVTYSAQMAYSGVLSGPILTGTGTVSLGQLTDYRIVSLASMVLPVQNVPDNSSAAVTFKLQADASLLLDEAWLFNIETGGLVWVDCGTGAPGAGGNANRLWIESPTIDNLSPNVFMGTQVDQSDARYPSTAFMGFKSLQFLPGTNNVFLVTTGALDAATTLSYYPLEHGGQVA